MPAQLRVAISRAMATSLADGGRLVQFSYFLAPPLAEGEVRASGLEARRARTVLTNFPPAFVWLYTKTTR